MRDENIFLVGVVGIAVAGLLFGWFWMKSVCSERASMEGYSISKTVATKCYATNDGKHWEKVWF